MTDELVVCSLEPWDEVKRRNQLLVERLLRSYPHLRVLFVEPAHDLLHVGRPNRSRLRRLDERLWLFRPTKAAPRRLGGYADASLCRQVRRALRALHFGSPAIWINDSTYAPLAERGWPTVYDITDDWLLARAAPHELARRVRLEERLLLAADEVVVCSPALALSRGAARPVTLVPNGVDLEHFRRPRARPRDLPDAAVYVGTLHDERVDVDLVLQLAAQTPVVLVGPDALQPASRRRLVDAGVKLLGARAYADVPAYFQHAEVVIVPHVVSPFTESLDPIKAYEIAAVGRPAVATDVSGFASLGIAVARDDFVDAVLGGGRLPERPQPSATWAARATAFAAVLERATA